VDRLEYCKIRPNACGLHLGQSNCYRALLLEVFGQPAQERRCCSNSYRVTILRPIVFSAELENLPCRKIISPRCCRGVLVDVLTLIASVVLPLPETTRRSRGYFEEWSIYYAGTTLRTCKKMESRESSRT